MALAESDISCFVANWEPKDGNIIQIAKKLNVGLDSLVFFDDNPAERELVRASLPDVTVIDVPEDPALFVRCLDDANLFDALSVTDEDRLRASFFRSESAREQLQNQAVNYEDYLKQLKMCAEIQPITEGNLLRGDAAY
jgi:FkbH-like protein